MKITVKETSSRLQAKKPLRKKMKRTGLTSRKMISSNLKRNQRKVKEFISSKKRPKFECLFDYK